MRYRSIAASLAVGLTCVVLSACGGSSPGDAALEPVEDLPAPVQSLVVGTDVGQFLATPEEGTPQADIDETVAKLKSMEGVQSAEVNGEGVVDLHAVVPGRGIAPFVVAAFGRGHRLEDCRLPH